MVGSARGDTKEGGVTTAMACGVSSRPVVPCWINHATVLPSHSLCYAQFSGLTALAATTLGMVDPCWQDLRWSYVCNQRGAHEAPSDNTQLSQ